MVQIRSAPVWVEEERLFKLIYLAYHDPHLPVNVNNQPGPAYAVSKDGLHWEKPSLGQVEVRGSTDNNRIATVSKTATWPINSLTDFVYDPADPNPARRFKGLLGATNRQPAISPDCLHWEKLDVPEIVSGDESQLVYDEDRRQFLATAKSYDPYGRTVSLATSPDFENWTPPRPILAADEQDRKDAGRVIKARLADSDYARPVFVDPDPGGGLRPADRRTHHVDVRHL